MSAARRPGGRPSVGRSRGARGGGATGSVRRGRRRPLTGVGGRAEVSGDPEVERVLAYALGVEPDESVFELTHGFHAYPGRMHPQTARRVLAWADSSRVVLDPFCGSGTVLVEARLAGRVAHGGDVHPLAVRLARLKSMTPSPRFPRALAQAGARVARRAHAAAKRSRGERIAGFDAARKLWQPHVARDLLALRAEICAFGRPNPVSEALWLVLSSLAVKVSDRASDTDARILPRRLAAGATTRLFGRKARELADRLAAYGRGVPGRTPSARIEVRDARARSPLSDASADLVLTSPPYPGTYDYTDHHAMRAWLLGIDASGAAATEIGARRWAGRGWQEGMAAALAEMARVLRPGGHALLLVGDGIEGDRRVDAAVTLEALGERVALRPVAAAWQTRPTRSGPERRILGPTKRETLLAMKRA